MSLREKLEDNKSVGYAVCGIAILLGFTLIFRWGFTSSIGSSAESYSNVGKAWYYVPETKETFADSLHKIPPITKDGLEAVLVHYFACGKCTDDSQFVGYYEKFTEETKQKAVDLSVLVLGTENISGYISYLINKAHLEAQK